MEIGKNMILYRPVGLQELELIYDSGMKAFPARLPQQPIFYPVLDLAYARQIASSWNAKNGQLAGYVTEFRMEDEYLDRFETHTIGGTGHEEYWIPSEEMEEFNRHITGHIKVLEAHFGDAFQGFAPEQFGLGGKNAVEQFTVLANSYLYKRMDFYLEIKRNHKAVFLNYPFWQEYNFKNPGLKEKILQAIKEAWLTSFPKTPLPLPVPAREESRVVEQADVVAQHLIDPDEDDLAPEEAIDEDVQDLADSVDEEITSLKRISPPALATPIREQITPVEEDDSNSWEDLIEEDRTPERETDGDLVDEESTSVKQTASPLWAHPVHQETTPVERTDSPAGANPVYQESAHPTQIGSHLEQGVKLGLSEKYREAVEELSQAVERDPTNAVARTSLGVAFQRSGEDERALACYEAALQIDPRSAEAHYFQANILYRHGNVREAIERYTIAIGLNPELIQAHERPAPQDRLTDYSPTPAEMHRIARPARRILDLDKSLEANPRQADLFKERAAAYSRLGNYEQAIADYSSSLALLPEDAHALHLRGVAYEQLGQPERAREDYRQAIAINPQLSNEYIQRGVTFGQMGNFHQSIASLTEGIRLALENPDGYFNRGMTYFQAGDFRRAIEDFSNVIRLSPGDEGAYYWRGTSNEEAGRRREAIADYQQFLMFSQDPQAREEIEQKLRRWNVGKENRVSQERVVPEGRPKTNQVESEKPDQKLDLYGLITTLGERALSSTWLGSGVECYGERAEELLSFVEQNRPIEGHDFLRITSGIDQTIKGDFQAFDPGTQSAWIFLRAWEGNGFYIEIDDRKSKERLKTQFPLAEEVEGVSPPFAGLFIPV